MDNETRERIEKEAVAFAAIILGEPPVGMDDTIVTGYKAGATAEHEHFLGIRKTFHEMNKKLMDDIISLKTEHSRITELLKEERNKAIDEVIKKLDNEYVERGDINAPWKNIKYDIESLKGKQQ